MPERVKFDVGFGAAGRPRDDDEPMRLLVLGDFSGRQPAERTPLATRPVHRVDLDNLDELVQRVQPRLSLPTGDVSFDQVDDFHPDRLYARLDVFNALRQARANSPAPGDDVLGRLLGKPAEPSAAPTPAPASGLDALIRNIVSPHVVKDTSAQTRLHVAGVDAAIAEQMRALLHNPRFQSLEAAWRGVRWLISSLELDEHLQLHLFDVTRDELLGDILAAQGQIAQTDLHGALVDRSDPAEWSALIGLFNFGRSAVAEHDAAAIDDWQSLRGSEAARWLGLATPRVLLRQPYGRGSDQIEAFAFEEFVGVPAHEEFLWGNPSLAIALLIGRGFAARGWDVQPGDEREIGDLPAYTFVRDGERELQACAERFLADSEIDKLIRAGLIPIVSRRNRNAVVVPRVQSISDPPGPLAW
jgi:type VI secretion system protein ImpC